MDIKLSSEEMESAVLEYVAKRVDVPPGYHLKLYSPYISGVTVEMKKVEVPAETIDEASGD